MVIKPQTFTTNWTLGNWRNIHEKTLCVLYSRWVKMNTFYLTFYYFSYTEWNYSQYFQIIASELKDNVTCSFPIVRFEYSLRKRLFLKKMLVRVFSSSSYSKFSDVTVLKMFCKLLTRLYFLHIFFEKVNEYIFYISISWKGRVLSY